MAGRAAGAVLPRGGLHRHARQGAGRRGRGDHTGPHPRRLHRRRARSGLRCRHGKTDDDRCRRRPPDPGRTAKNRPRDPGRLQLPLQPGAPPRARAARRAGRRRDRVGAVRVAARHLARRRLLPALAPRQCQLRRAAGAQVKPPLRSGELVARRRTRDRVRDGTAFLLWQGERPVARAADRLRARYRRGRWRAVRARPRLLATVAGALP